MNARAKTASVLADPAFYITDRFHPHLRELRIAGPVHWTQAWPQRGVWSVVRHREVSEVLLKPEVFSSELRGNFLPPDPHMFDRAEDRVAAGFGRVPGFTDPPRHGIVRKQVSKPFLPQLVTKLTDDCRAICNSAVDDVIERGQCDFVTDVVAKIPMSVICAFMDVPREDWESLTRIVNAYISFADPDFQLADTPAETYRQAKDRLFAYIGAHMRTRRVKSADSFTGLLSRVSIDDEPLPEADMCWWAWNVLLAGFETSRNVMSQALLALIENPSDLRRLHAAPELAMDAAEEFSRWATPAHSLLRVATQDAVIGSQAIKEGDWILLWLASANRDESVFQQPFKINITRRPNPHLAFGIGAHNCIGRRIALLEIRLLVNTVVARLDHIEVAGPIEWTTGMAMGLKHLPIRFREREGTACRTSN